MSSLFLSLVAALVLVSSAAGATASPSPLRICADPDNLPFSNRAVHGFDNRIAVYLAHSLGRQPVFVWARSRRGFLREQFNKGACDVLMGAPRGMRAVNSSVPYYRSAYVFVTPAKEHLQITRFDDPHLDGRRIGLQVLEEDLSPPSLPLIRNGHAARLVGFESFGSREGEILHAVADGRIGAAVVWGPIAGYFAETNHLPVVLAPVSPEVDSSGVPFAFEICVAVHKGDTALLKQIDAALPKLQRVVDNTLAAYHVPTFPAGREAR